MESLVTFQVRSLPLRAKARRGCFYSTGSASRVFSSWHVTKLHSVHSGSEKDRIAIALCTNLDFDSVCKMFETDKNDI